MTDTPPIVSSGNLNISMYLEEIKTMLDKSILEKKAFSTVSTKNTSLKEKKSTSLLNGEDV